MSLPVLAPELQLLYIRPSHFHRLKTPICRQSISRYHSEAKKEMEIKSCPAKATFGSLYSHLHTNENIKFHQKKARNQWKPNMFFLLSQTTFLIYKYNDIDISPLHGTPSIIHPPFYTLSLGYLFPIMALRSTYPDLRDGILE